ncbi:S8 family serine peptidase [Novosphingobium sp.]|uniref:S8 family serine peptidase n=1 Tax=Novosphingobium sp. TaxID=1874826 RepID=UPI001DBB309F|nr:S8 family serine peptidase [Novosphingobium sp.]MBX9663459.1 S8 family serine peptidase [Novosphingobium sp.]
MADPVRIAVIDSGVHPGHPHIAASRLLPGVTILPDGTPEQGANAALDRVGHGTAVTAAIQELAPRALILPIRVFRDALRASPRALIAAMDWASAEGADFINLSLGTTNPAHADHFAAAVARSTARIVAPRTAADDAPCWPGMLAGIIAVGLDWDVARGSVRLADDGVYHASGYPRPIEGVPQQRNLHGISFATAQVTGLAAANLLPVSPNPAASR